MIPEKIPQEHEIPLDSTDVEREQKRLDVEVKIIETEAEQTRELSFINEMKRLNLAERDVAKKERRENDISLAEIKLLILKERLAKYTELSKWIEGESDRKYSVQQQGSWKEGEEHSNLVKLQSILKGLASPELQLSPKDRLAVNEELFKVDLQIHKNLQRKA